MQRKTVFLHSKHKDYYCTIVRFSDFVHLFAFVIDSLLHASRATQSSWSKPDEFKFRLFVVPFVQLNQYLVVLFFL